MDESVKKFLEFNGKSIYFLAKDGQYYVALKPICRALGLDWIAQYKSVKLSKILGLVLSNQTIPDARNRAQEMACLPEKYIYGWLFKLQSSAPGFEEFQAKCYDLLYDYFHGTIAKRISTLKSKREIYQEIAELTKQINASEDGQRILSLKKELAGTTRELKDLDAELTDNQTRLF